MIFTDPDIIVSGSFMQNLVMIQMSVSEPAKLKTKKWIFPVFYGFHNRDSNAKAWKICLEHLEPCYRAWSGKLQPTDGLCPNGGAHPLIYRDNS